MKVAGLQKTTLIDYPEKIASIIFTQGCNMKCPYCHNPSLIPSAKDEQDFIPLDQLWHFIDHRKELIDGIVITGGEPTLQQGLIDFIKKINSNDLKVKLDTNGSNPNLLAKLINQELLDYIAMDIKAPFAKNEPIIGKSGFEKSISKSIELIKKSTINYEFRTTVVPTLHDAKTIDKIGKLINGSKRHYIQNFRPKNTLDSELLKIKEFPPAKLKEFKSILSKYVERVFIRN
ncbi:anaerobic ribonucleoside-triphosphate reductase activating protein [Halobacteroides halobius DSM 5150]|uniref:Anaerobic ribonucleoside-triphosphate reductase activating protein n=1 Tax=Halobacteroides halobius (strain ATCC 35273 / DSM 5150 / MD-1) TaxID=748449 RepID=L0KC04_HALHC|nr:anaerobic ribonucleoside-triphosphate reductase activating protein [Halobacteroides halobius]AGB42085.1 anaerobic ribonucleoside-triphosphate reductase activating protein [Halobacteroides halobius DSM 5150]